MNNKDARFDRQVRAFGPALHLRLREQRIGIIGVGGLGSVMVEQLIRLGASDVLLIDPDRVDMTNLNRLVTTTFRDARRNRPKVKVLARTVKDINPDARVTTLELDVCDKRALTALRNCTLIIVATDDQHTRLVVNALACQYLIPYVHAGVNLDPKGGDISGEYAIPELGSWCLWCADVVNLSAAAREVAPAEEQSELKARGYLTGEPAPAVYHLNSTIASLAVAEIHNLLAPYKPPRRYVVYRALQGDLLTINPQPDADCLHCGPTGRRGLGDLAPLWTMRR
jgi:molybdopterin-synthase adenylyltransferase